MITCFRVNKLIRYGFLAIRTRFLVSQKYGILRILITVRKLFLYTSLCSAFSLLFFLNSCSSLNPFSEDFFLLGIGNTFSNASDLIGQPAPELAMGQWINSPPLQLEKLRGRVVLIHFWNHRCPYCVKSISYLKDWNNKFAKSNFQLLTIHVPESETEAFFPNLPGVLRELGIQYPVLADNWFENEKLYHQQYFPTSYLVDKQGIVRYTHVGTGRYLEIEKKIQLLLSER